MALIPQVVDAVSVPVVAAGGIGDGRGIAAAFALGACGVQMGTAFLSCPEAATDPRRRELLRQASDRDTMVTDAISGRSARVVRNPYAEAMAPVAGSLPDFPLLYALSGPALAASREQGSDLVSFHLYGQAAGLNVELPAAELIEKLVADTRESVLRLAS
jgi:nitronate monooxygenase